MKKLSLIALVLAATSARADFWSNCTAYGGTIITANKYGTDANGNNLDKGGYCNDPTDTTKTNNCNGKKFCVGKTMNWWSAFTWCESIGGKVPSFSSLCPGVPTAPNNTIGACPNVKSIMGSDQWGWTGLGWNTRQTLSINLSSGAVGHKDYYDRNTDGNRAVCEE